MKRIAIMFAALLLAPGVALAQGGASNGTTGKPASINAVQVGGRDPSSNLQALKVDASGALLVAAGGATTDQVQGNVASGAADSGNPVKVGGRYNSSLPTLTNGQRGDLQLNAAGGLITQLADNNGITNWFVSPGVDAHTNNAAGYVFYTRQTLFNGSTWDRARGDTNGTVVQPALSSTFWKYAAASSGIVNTTTAVTVKAAAGASVRNYVMSMQCSHDTLGAVTEFAIRDGAAGTVMWRGKLQTTATDASGATINFEPPLQGTANTLTEIVTLTAVTGGVYCNLQGYTGA